MSKLTETKFWKVWKNMIRRCTIEHHPDYKNYGGRGIKVSESWLLYDNFEDDMYLSYADFLYDNQEKPTLDRIDNSKGYSKENCRWATMKQQSNNRRRSATEKLFELNGEIKNMSEWANSLGFKTGTLRARLRYGWTFDKAIKEKVDTSKHKKHYPHSLCKGQP